MRKPKNKSIHKFNHTPVTLLVASLGGACAFITIESECGDVMVLIGHQASRLEEWRMHMGSMCAGITAFAVCLFCLEIFETRSWRTAWRSSAAWLPLVGLTALATAVHIPIYIVISAGSICGVWAYRRTCSVRRSDDYIGT